MPTEKKERDIADLEKRISESTIAITTDYSGMSVGDMTTLRRALRVDGVDFRVVKNSLAYLAADAAGRPQFKEIVQGPTGVAFGYGEVVDPARVLTEYIKDSDSALKIRGAIMGDRTLTAAEVGALGKLPHKNVLIAQLAGQLQGGIVRLVYVLSAPLTGLAVVIQRHAEAMEAASVGGTAPAETTAEVAEDAPVGPEAEPKAEPEAETNVEDEPEAKASGDDEGAKESSDES